MPRKKYYQRYKAAGLCTHCGKRKARPNGIKCETCYSTVNAASLAWKRRPENREKVRKHYRDKKDRMRATGRCPMCTAPLHEDADKGKINCMNCRQKLFRRDLQLYPKERDYANITRIHSRPLQHISLG